MYWREGSRLRGGQFVFATGGRSAGVGESGRAWPFVFVNAVGRDLFRDRASRGIDPVVDGKPRGFRALLINAAWHNAAIVLHLRGAAPSLAAALCHGNMHAPGF